MSNTPIELTTDLSQVLAQITQKLDQIDQKFEAKLDKIDQKFETKLDKIDERLNKLEVGQAKLEEKMEGLGKRFESQEFISRGVVIGLIVAILGGLAKLFGFVGNP